MVLHAVQFMLPGATVMCLGFGALSALDGKRIRTTLLGAGALVAAMLVVVLRAV